MDIPEYLITALQADDAGELDAVVARHDQVDLDALRQIAADTAQPGEIRQRAIHALGRWGDAASVPVIAEAVAGLSEPAVMTAVEALGRLGGAAALPTILEAAGHPSPHVRKFAARALSRFDDPVARDRLARLARADDAEFVREVGSRLRRSSGEG